MYFLQKIPKTKELRKAGPADKIKQENVNKSNSERKNTITSLMHGF